MVLFRGQRMLWAMGFVGMLLRPHPASAQSAINFNGGVSIDPEQIYAGVSWESPDIGGRFRIRPGIDGGMGDGLRLGTINIDLIAKFPLGTSGWTLLQGGGPTIIVAKFTGAFEDVPRELHAGGSYLFGFQHDNGFFTEFRVGGGSYVPQLKLGVGWAVKIQ
jgi:hypothetical protein